ncbi:hypothetical protein KDL45_04635, partial [bacterium]|nr:hypothetical protein [bacterium]
MQSIAVDTSTDVAGLSWGDLIPNWMRELIGLDPIVVTGLSWGDLVPNWLQQLIGIDPINPIVVT